MTLMTDERYRALDKIARSFMESRADLQAMSLDDWMMEHSDKLSDRERGAALAILQLYDAIAAIEPD